MDITNSVVGTRRWNRVGTSLGMAVVLLAPGLGAATIRGRVTECSGAAGSPGHIVKAFEEVRIGFREGIRPCNISTQPPRQVGTSTTRADGSYTITYTPTEEDPESCLFESKVFVRVFLPDGTTLIHTSSKKTSRDTVTIEAFDTGGSAACPRILIPASLELDPPSIIAGGPPANARLSFSVTGGSRAEPTTLSLFASDDDGIVMQQTLVVPANQTTASFPISASPPGGKVVTIFAAANGTTIMADLAIRPNGTMKGLINDDDRRDISDPVFLLNFLFLGGKPPAFSAFADVNSSGGLDIADAVAMLSFLFGAGEIPGLCTSDPATLPSDLQLLQELVTDGDRVCMFGDFPSEIYRIGLKGFTYPNGRLISGNQVVGDRQLVYCACVPAVRSLAFGPDGETFFQLCFNVPLDAPTGEYEVSVLPGGGSCPVGNLVGSGCVEDDCAIGPMKLFVQPSQILSLMEELIINDNSEPAGDHPAEMFFVFASQTGEPDASGRFPVQFADSYPGGRPDSQHLTNTDQTTFRPEVPVFVGREVDMERTECEEECLSDPDPARCRTVCAEAARRMNNSLAMTVGGAEFDCLEGCGSIWDEVAGIGTAVLGCLVGVKTGNPVAGCTAGITLGAIFEKQLEEAIEDEDDVLGTADFNFTRGGSPFWAVGATSPPGGLSKTDIDISVTNHRLPAFRLVEAKLNLQSITLIEADDEPCFAPDEIFFETRASLGLNGRLGESTRFPGTSGLSMAEGDTQDLSSFSLSAGDGADSGIVYVEIGVWDDDGDDENELIGLHSTTHFLGDVLEAIGVPGADFVVDGRELRRRRLAVTAQVSGWNSGERCDCETFACGFNPRIPHGKARISYEIDVTWEKYPR